MSIEKVLEDAIEREVEAYEFYQQVYERVDDSTVKDVFAEHVKDVFVEHVKDVFVEQMEVFLKEGLENLFDDHLKMLLPLQ